MRFAPHDGDDKTGAGRLLSMYLYCRLGLERVKVPRYLPYYLSDMWYQGWSAGHLCARPNQYLGDRDDLWG